MGVPAGVTTPATISTPVLTLDVRFSFLIKFYQNVIFNQPTYNFNSFIELNKAWGKVIIKNSQFLEFNTCGAIIRNKRYIHNGYSATSSSLSTHMDYFKWRHNKLLFDEYTRLFNPTISAPPCEATGCFQIIFEKVTFSNFGSIKPQLTVPVAVNPVQQMKYTGQVLDLDGFDGQVGIYLTTFNGIALKYQSCAVAKTMLTVDPATIVPDKYSGFGTKSKYQIKSLISIVNQMRPVHIIGSTFQSNSGTKGIIYIDMLESTTQERVIFFNNKFYNNAGYVDSNVIFIRARSSKLINDPAGTGTMPSNPNHCSGFSFEKNDFQNNIGCVQTSGSAIKFECIDNSFTTSTNYIDQISTDLISGSSWVKDQYNAIGSTMSTLGGGFTASTYAYAVTSTSTSYTQVDKNFLMFKQNLFYKNFGSGGRGLVDIYGVPRIKFDTDDFQNNGDAHLQINAKLNINIIGTYPTIISAGETIGDATQSTNAGFYPVATLMKSVINIQRGAYIELSSVIFKANWLLENGVCTESRAQLIYVSEFAGDILFNGITISNHQGVKNNAYISTGSPNLNINIGTVSTYQGQGAETPLFRFAPSVMIETFTVKNFQMSGGFFVENSACATMNYNYLFGFSTTGAFANNFIFGDLSGTQSLISSFQCKLCTKPLIQLSELTQVQTVSNIKFSSINDQIKTGTYVAQNPLMAFNLYRPYKSPSGSTTYFKPTVTITKVFVEFYYLGGPGGQVFNFKRVPYPIATDDDKIAPLDPSTDTQITIDQSSFTTVWGSGDGVFATTEVDNIIMSIKNTQFSDIKSTSGNSYGVLYGKSLGELNLFNVQTSGLINQVTLTAGVIAGGGRFFYTNQPSQAFTLSISGASNFQCATGIYTVASPEISNMNSASPFPTQGSCFELVSDTQPFTITIDTNIFQYCYGANQGGVFSIRTLTQPSLPTQYNEVMLKGNQFLGNAALYGGSIFCQACKVTTDGIDLKWSNNQFKSDYALWGGDIYLQNIFQPMSATSYMTFENHYHTLSSAKNQGGGIYYLEEFQEVRLKFMKTASITTACEFSSLTTTTLEGGAFYLSAVKQIEIQILDYTFSTNSAGTSGGGFYLATAADKVDVKITNGIINTNKAKGGSGGFLYMPVTSLDSSVIIDTTTFMSNQAFTDGGILYMAGAPTALKSLKLTNLVKLDTQVTTNGNGGVAYISGLSSDILVENTPALPGQATINNNNAGNSGGLFYSVVDPASTLGCVLNLKRAYISGGTTVSGTGGLYSCQGGGPGTINLLTSSIAGVQSQSHGGAFYMKMTGDITMKIEQVLTTDTQFNIIDSVSSKAGSGGLAYLETGLTASVIIDVGKQTIIKTMSAGLQGGVFLLGGGLDNTLNFLNQVSVTYVGAQEGSAAVFWGTNNYLTSDNQFTLGSCTASVNAGCFKLTGTNINQVVLDGNTGLKYSPSFLNHKATAGNGGFLYMMGKLQTVSMKEYQTPISSMCGGKGGVIFSDPQVAGATVDIKMNSAVKGTFVLSPISAGLQGSFLYVTGTLAPTAKINVENVQFQCVGGGATNDFCQNQVLFGKVYDNLKLATPVTIGGLFYFETGVIGQVTSKTNDFKRCYSTNFGSVWYLPINFNLDDQDSTYSGLAGKAGIIYCDQCIVLQKRASYDCNMARQATILYMLTGTDGGTQTSVTISDAVKIKGGRSFSPGGGIYVGGSNTGQLILNNDGVIQFFESESDGGFFYVTTPSVTLTKLDGTNFNHLKSFDHGGYIEGTSATVDSSFAVDCKLGNITDTIPAVNAPSFSGSAGGLNVKGCDVTCGIGAVTVQEQQQALAKTAGLFSLYQVSNLVMVAEGNTIRNCTAVEGAIFKFDSTDFTDYNSVFEYNGALRGGVAHCYKCKMRFVNSTFRGNYANQGGIFFIQQYGELLLENVTIDSTRAHFEGGIAYANGTKSDINAQSVSAYVPVAPMTSVNYVNYIKITIKMNEDRNFTGMESLQNGAGIYLKNGMLTVDNMTISLANASQNGGFIYSDGHVEITINNSTFKNLSAERGGFMYSGDSEGLPALAKSLFVKFTTLNYLQGLYAKTGGGGFYVNNPNMEIFLNTPINVYDAKTTAGHGGMFFLEQVKSVNFKQTLSTDIGNYTKLAAPHPNYGSFMYSKALNANIDLQNLLIQCQSFPPVTTSVTEFKDYLQNSNVLPKYGGAIYVTDATLVSSQLNTFQNCYQTNEGGIFHITTQVNAATQPKYTKFQELGGSLYKNNQAEKGGIIYCEKCILEMTPSPKAIDVQDNWAKYGGAIYIQEVYLGKIGAVNFLRNTASIEGGVFAMINKQTNFKRSSVVLDSTKITKSVTDSPSNGWGGVFYFETVQLDSFTVSKSIIDGATANLQGGIFFVETMTNGLIKVDQGTQLKNFYVEKSNLGSLFYSAYDTTVTFSILNSFVTCNTTANWADAVAAVNSVNSYRAGSIYMENSLTGVISNTNTFSNCNLAQDGGIYYIVNSKLADTNSYYIQISALYGSVMKCRNCDFTFTSSYMDGCYAESGGAFMIENDATGLVFGTSFIGTHAKNQGGLMNVVQSGLVTLSETKYIIFDSCPLIQGNNAQQGGVFYLNQPKTRVKVIRSTISKSHAYDRAGVIYVQNALEVTLEMTSVINIFSSKSTILYSTSTQLQLNIVNSKIICNTSYVTFDNVDEFKKQNVPFNSTNSFYLSGNQQTQINSLNSQFSQCGMMEDGGLFRMEGKVNFYDEGSQYFENSGVEGGVFSCSQCNLTLYNTVMKKNLAKRGGVIKVEASGNFTSMLCGFFYNQAVEIGGVVFLTTQSLFNIMDSSFISNFANVSSSIDVLGSNSYLPNRISRCQFQNNTAIKNTVSFKESKAIIENTKFRDNYSIERSKNLFVAFAEVNISGCYFSSPEYPFPMRMLAKDQTMGAFIFIILDVKIIISNSIFSNGLARYGGAIYISGQSDITINNCQIMKNQAYIYGGAIFANGFRSIRVINGSRILDNTGLLQGDDFYLSNTEDIFELNRITVSNAYAKNSLYAQQVTLVMKDVKYQNMQFSPYSEKGAAIQCFGCRKIDIQDSWFKGIKSQVGGALHLTDMPTNKRVTDGADKYRIVNTMFESVSSNLGGALYLDHPQYFQIINSTFLHVRALNRSSDVASSTQAGVGGSIYYHCSIVDPQCQLQISGNTLFQYNYAAIKGGAIHYTYYEPKMGPNVTFELNKAGWYGDSISSYAQQLMPVKPSIFNRTIRKIDNPLSYQEFLGLVAQYESNKTAKMKGQRKLEVYQDDEPLVDMFQTIDKTKYTATNQRSGGSIPDFQLALVDKYGQIVCDFDSKLRVTVDTDYFAKDDQTRRYTPVLEGTTQFTVYGGVSMVSNLMFSGAPGYKYRLAFLASGIDEKLPENALFKERFKEESIEFDFFLELRECERGEYFSLVGKCVWCEPTMGYALVKMKEPGECKPCPWDRGNCKGGYNIGPLPGYWRKSNSTANMLRCPNPKVCLGWVEPTWNEIGECAEGQTGVLCAQCMPGYSLTGLAQCAKCPDLTSNVVKMVGITLLIIFIFAFMVRSTLAGATQQKNNTSIYMKILMNHFQLILLVSSFNFQWPKQIEVFFSATSPVSEASSQIVSIDCFMSSKASFASQPNSFFKTYFLKLLIFALLPFILALISWVFWWVQKMLKKTQFEGGKFVATLVISLFTIHPNIVQNMFNDYNCRDIDGDKFVLVDMTIKCWDTAHTFWSYSVAMPSIIAWGLGIPFFALVLMTRERHQLDKIETKEKFGFLYNGYTQALFFWEIVIMYRKIAMIFISVFIQPYGVISQALIVFMLMIIFLIANLKKKPYLSMSLNDLETISLITSTVSIYCGIFFITDIPAKDIPNLPTSVKSGITLSESMKFLFFVIIMVANMAFFGYWFYKIIEEVRNTLIKKFEKGYLYLFLCGDKIQLEKIKRQMKIDEENELLREKYFKSVSHLKNLYKEGKLVLTQQTLERAQVYLNEDRYMDALGLARRDITDKELKRFQRMAQGAEVKHNERQKAEYTNTFVKNMDMRRDHITGTYINPDRDIIIDEEYMQGLKKNPYLHPSEEASGKVVGIRPESQQTFKSGASGYNGENEHIETQGTYLHTTPKNNQSTVNGMMDEMDGPHNQSNKMLLNGSPQGYGLDQELVKKAQNKISQGKHQAKKNSSSIEKGSDLEDVDFRGKSKKNGRKGAEDGSSDTDDEQNNKMMWNELEEDINQHHPKAIMNQFKKAGAEKNQAAKETKLSKEASKKKKEDDKLYNEELDINGMIRQGHIQVQATKVKVNDKKLNKFVEGENNKILERKSKKPQAPTPTKAAEPNTDKLEKDLFKDLGGGNVSVESEGEAKPKPKKQLKVVVDSDSNESNMFSDDADASTKKADAIKNKFKKLF